MRFTRQTPLLCFSLLDWDDLWHRPQELMSRFAADGHVVLYVDTVGVRSPTVRDARRILRRLANRLQQGTYGIRQITATLYVHSPLILPFSGLTAATTLNVTLLKFGLQRAMHRIGLEEPLVWTYIASPAILQVILGLQRAGLIYDCLDAIAHNPLGVTKGYLASERSLLRQSDMVLTTSEALFSECRGLNLHTYFVPYGVNWDFYEEARAQSRTRQKTGSCISPEIRTPGQEANLARFLSHIPRPWICFFGSLDHRLDLELLKRLATSHPEWSIVLMGKSRIDLACLLATPNIKFLGYITSNSLPTYLMYMDVFIIPYLLNEFTMRIRPGKLYECLATGRPIVSTSLPELAEFGDLVRVAGDHDEFIQYTAEAVHEDDEQASARRIELARNNSWASRYQCILSKLISISDTDKVIS